MAVTIAGTTAATWGVTAASATQTGINVSDVTVEAAPQFRAELQGPTGEVQALAIGRARYTATVTGEVTGLHGFTVTAGSSIALGAAAGTFGTGSGYYLTSGTITFRRDGWKGISATLESIPPIT